MPEESLQYIKQAVVVEQVVSRATIEAEVREEVAQFLESCQQVRHPEFLRGIEGGDVDEDGWENMKLTEQHLCRSLAGAVRRGQKARIVQNCTKPAVSLDDVVKETNAR